MKKQSPITIFLKTTKKNIRIILKDAGIPKYKLKDSGIIESLLRSEYIRLGSKPGEYIITPKGIWDYENEKKIYELDDFLSFIDKEYFNLFKSQTIHFNTKEKVVVFSMLAIRAFNKENSIDLNVDQAILDKWNGILDKSREKLFNLGIINQAESDNFWKKNVKKDDINSACYYILRHMNKLSEKTNDLYKSPGNKKYFLNISLNQELLKADLAFLINKVFEGIELNHSIKENIIEFFKGISFEYSIYVFYEVNDFATPKFDAILKEIILFL